MTLRIDSRAQLSYNIFLMTQADNLSQQDLQREQENSDAILFFKKLIALQIEDPQLFLLQTAKPEELHKIQEKLQTISTTQLLELYGNNQEFQTFLIQIVFLQREDKLYREGTGRKSIQATWSDKLMSLVGSLDGTQILSGILNHQGDLVRTKADDHYKAAESAEVRAIHAEYLDGYEPSIAKVLAEVADVVYNLTQLLLLDPDPDTREKYEKYLAQTDEIYGVPRASMLALSVAKYHHRMYFSKNGKNAHQSEDRLILQVLSKHFPHLLSDADVAKKTVNDSFKHFDKIFEKLQGILVKKFIKEYDHLDQGSQRILEKTIDNSMKMLQLLSQEFSLKQVLIAMLSAEEEDY